MNNFNTSYMDKTLLDFKESLSGPICVLSCRAGMGNFYVGKAIHDMFYDLESYHIPIEEVISEHLMRSDFSRYKRICSQFSFLLHLIYKLPLSYYLKYFKVNLSQIYELDKLVKFLKIKKIKTIVAVNHRAALYASHVLNKLDIKSSLWGVATNFSISSGWRFQNWHKIDKFFAYLDVKPLWVETEYFKISFPVRSIYKGLKYFPKDINQVIVAGGAWGLGRIRKIVRELSLALPDLTIHVLCGENTNLKKILQKEYLSNRKIKIYGFLDNLVDMYKMCKSIITKPGAVTIAEAVEAGNKIFLSPGLPGCEEGNYKIAVDKFDAQKYSLKNYLSWYKKECV